MIETKQIERPKLILIADDIEINQDALGVILEEDYHLLFAENGKEALEMMYSHKDDLSMLLLDLNMPLMNGYEVLEHIRQDEQLQHIPVIVLTADKSAGRRRILKN
jgi:CheY-like chemotaxis protein